MLSTDTIAAFVATADTSVLCDVLTEHSLLGTEVGDRVLAASLNHPERHAALLTMFAARNVAA